MAKDIARNEVTTQPKFGPPKYQLVVPKKAKSVLKRGGKRILAQAELITQKVVSVDDDE